MANTQPGDRIPADAQPRARQLAEPPSARYAARETRTAGDEPGASGSALRGPLLRAALVAVAGALALVVVGGILASTFGLLLVSGATGSAVGLVLARATAPGDASRPTARGTVVRIAVGMAIAAVLLGDVGLWLVARQQGGTLGLLDFLWTTFGPFVPGDVIVATLTAWWGASAGPVQR